MRNWIATVNTILLIDWSGYLRINLESGARGTFDIESYNPGPENATTTK